MFTLPRHISFPIQKGTRTLVTSYNGAAEVSTNKRQFLSLHQTSELELRVLIELPFQKEYHVNSEKLVRTGTTSLEDLILIHSVSRQDMKSCYNIKVAAKIKLKLPVKEIHVFQLKSRYSELYLASLKMRRLLHSSNQRKGTLM